MALQRLPLKKLVVEWRYKPSLAFYGRMDAVGLALSDDYPDWERSALTVEVRNKKRHRRLFCSHIRSFFESDNPDPHSEFDEAKRLMDLACAKLEISQFTRLGIRQWFAADLEKAFAAMVDTVAARYLAQNEQLKAVLGGKIKDVAYVVHLEGTEGWQYHLSLGPMLRAEWFGRVRYEPGNFEAPENDESRTFEKFQKAFPDQFLFVDIDCFREECQIVDLAGLLREARRRSQEMAVGLIDISKAKS